MSSEAFVTLATTDAYALGALVLAQSIRQVGTKRNLVVLISNRLSYLIRETLERIFDNVVVVEELNSNDDEHLRLLERPELGITFTKINCWLLEQYTKCVFLDSDCLVLQDIDDLFQREEFSAAPDAGWPDCFNSGVFVFKPSKDTFIKLMTFASQQNASFDGGDQGLLNGFFSNWRSGDISRHLPFTYNVTANAFYSYLPAVTRFRNDINVVHFAGSLKPWNLTYNPQNEHLSGNLGGQNDIQREFFRSWWRIMHQHIWPLLSQLSQKSNSNNESSFNGQGQFGGLIGFDSCVNFSNNSGIELGSVAHRRAWESGHIDYFGRDSFSNIQQQLERNIALNNQQYHPSQQRQTTPEKPTSILKHSNKETTTTTHLSQHPIVNGNHSLKESHPPPPPQSQSNHSLKHSIETTSHLQKEVTTPLSQSTNIQKPLSKETTTSSSITDKNHSSLVDSIRSNENKSLSHDHESNWTVKSTIVTAYTQGVGELSGPTVLNKVVTESSASSSNHVPIITSIHEEKVNSKDFHGNPLTGNGTSLRGATSLKTTTTTTSNGHQINK